MCSGEGMCRRDEMGTCRTEWNLARGASASGQPVSSFFCDQRQSGAFPPVPWSHLLKFGEKSQRIPNREITWVHFFFILSKILHACVSQYVNLPVISQF